MTNRHIYFSLFVAAVALLAPIGASAFESGFYPSSSVLASGKWVKIRIDDDGLYRISRSTLRSWGFSDPAKVRVYGTGGARMQDALTEDNVHPDLPLLQSALTDDGSVIFYGRGPGSWNEYNTLGRYAYELNVYSSAAYYYLTETESVQAREIPMAAAGAAPASDTELATSFFERLHHETETSSPGEAGALLVGEDFRYTPSRNIDFDLPAPWETADNNLWLQCSFITHYTSGYGTLAISANGNPSEIRTVNLPSSGTSGYTHGTETLFSTSMTLSGESSRRIRIGLSLTNNGSTDLAALNYLSINYLRKLTLPESGYLAFASSRRCGRLTGIGADRLTLWDVTDPQNILAVPAADSSDASALAWNSTTGRRREFVAFRPDASLPTPRLVGQVTNQNLHAQESPDMVIIAPHAFISEAQRLVDFHASTSDSLRVTVADIDEIYAEFSGGHQDPGGIRSYLKMLYDRGREGDGRPLRYALILGRMTVDNRHLLPGNANSLTIPGWCPWPVRASLSDNEGYFTDDYYAMLDDGAGANMRTDKLRIAVGRMPVLDVSELRDVITKEIEYGLGARHTAWKHRMMFLADDGDGGIHLSQSEKMLEGFQNVENIPYVVRKVYLESYAREGGQFPGARAAMFRNLDEGVVWWNFIGHASATGWTADGQLNYTDLNQLYLRHLPFIYAATCNFLRLDAGMISGAELLYKERYGGCIGVISATRPVYIADNGPLSAAVGRAAGLRDERGRLLTPGEIYRRGKNDIRNSKDEPAPDANRLRYVFVGDPALRLAVPDIIVRIDSIGGKPVDPDNPPAIAALSRTEIAGSIVNPDGSERSDFNGIVTIDIMDAERTLTTTPLGADDKPINFEDLGERVYTGSTEVKDGRFTLSAAMPAELEQNYRPAALGAFAYSSEHNDEAAGLFRDFYLYGYDETVPDDTEAPSIDEMFLNHSTFRSGDTVNDSPMLIAAISDNVGINVSTAGVGHQITATLDGTRTFSDLASYFTPSTDGSPSGVINYPFENLTEGLHTLSLRIWDTFGNSARKDIDFFVAPGLAPKIYDIYSDCNPASTSANFYLSHDQPDGMVTVEVTVYNLLGRPVWSGSASGRSDMFLSVPVTWDLTDNSGARVPRGIYLYRARISSSTPGSSYETATRRLAVTAR